MKEIKKYSTEVTIPDLKAIGLNGNATALLLSGEMVYLKAKFATKKCLALVDGKEQEVEVIIPYSQLYREIRTIKSNNLLIARRIEQGQKTILQLTGKGYHRPTWIDKKIIKETKKL